MSDKAKQFYDDVNNEITEEQVKVVKGRMKQLILEVERCRVDLDIAQARLVDFLDRDIDDICPLDQLGTKGRM